MNNWNSRFLYQLLPILGLLMFTNLGYGQRKDPWFLLYGKSIVELRATKPIPFKRTWFTFQEIRVKPEHRLSSRLMMKKSMPKVYSYKDLAMFCKLEVQLEQTMKFPIKVRLGEVQYVERMEGKYDY